MTNLAVAASPVELGVWPANQMRFRCRTCGLRQAGEAVVLLHGFPETSFMWQPLIEFLAPQGYRCLAPDQRGYSPQARPKRKSAYAIDQLAADVVALADQAGFARFHLIGHDWGAMCGWITARLYPGRVQSLTALSVPHPLSYLDAKLHDAEQKKMSWYVDFFQLPLLPEWGLGFRDYKILRKQWESFSEAEKADCLAVFAPFSGRRATINWYRANVRKLAEVAGPVATPTLLIWGNQDPFIGRTSVQNSGRYLTGAYTFLELDAGHALVHKTFDRVSAEILSHLRRHAAKA